MYETGNIPAVLAFVVVVFWLRHSTVRWSLPFLGPSIPYPQLVGSLVSGAAARCVETAVAGLTLVCFLVHLYLFQLRTWMPRRVRGGGAR